MEQRQQELYKSTNPPNDDFETVTDKEYTVGDGWPWLQNSKSERYSLYPKVKDKEAKMICCCLIKQEMVYMIN